MKTNTNLLSEAADFTIYNDFSSNVKFLYCELVLLANKNFWKMPLTISDRQLAAFMNIDVKTLIKARDFLVEMGKISFTADKFGTYYYVGNKVEKDDQNKISENYPADFQKSPTPTLDKPQADAGNQPSKQNKTKQNKTKQNKTIDRSKNDKKTDFLTNEGVDDLTNSEGKNDTVHFADPSEYDPPLETLETIEMIEDDGYSFEENDRDDEEVEVSIIRSEEREKEKEKKTDPSSNSSSHSSSYARLSDSELRAIAAFDTCVHQHSEVEKEKLLSLIEDFGANTVIKAIGDADKFCKSRGDRIQSINYIITILNKRGKENGRERKTPAQIRAERVFRDPIDDGNRNYYNEEASKDPKVQAMWQQFYGKSEEPKPTTAA